MEVGEAMKRFTSSMQAKLALPPLLNRGRARRVTVLAAGIIILSFADLAVTLAFLRANWMMEANPIAAYLIEQTQSPWVLAAFKSLTVAICVGLLYRLRHYRCGEVAAWSAVFILAVMSVMWHSYSSHFDGADSIALAQSTSIDVGQLALP
jgi:hypothetical protein